MCWVWKDLYPLNSRWGFSLLRLNLILMRRMKRKSRKGTYTCSEKSWKEVISTHCVLQNLQMYTVICGWKIALSTRLWSHMSQVLHRTQSTKSLLVLSSSCRQIPHKVLLLLSKRFLHFLDSLYDCLVRVMEAGFLFLVKKKRNCFSAFLFVGYCLFWDSTVDW